MPLMYLPPPQAPFFTIKQGPHKAPQAAGQVQVCSHSRRGASAGHLCSVTTHCSRLERAELPGLCWHPNSLCQHMSPEHKWFICSGEGAQHCRAQPPRECLESTLISWDDTGAEMQHKSLMPRKYQWAPLAYSFPCAHLCEATTA